jgi:hypothetical protein
MSYSFAHILPRVLTFLGIKIFPCNQTTWKNLFYRVQIWFESIWSFLQKFTKENRKRKEKRKKKKSKGLRGNVLA